MAHSRVRGRRPEATLHGPGWAVSLVPITNDRTSTPCHVRVRPVAFSVICSCLAYPYSSLAQGSSLQALCATIYTCSNGVSAFIVSACAAKCQRRKNHPYIDLSAADHRRSLAAARDTRPPDRTYQAAAAAAMEIERAVRGSGDARLLAKYDAAVYIIRRAYALYPYVRHPVPIHTVQAASMMPRSMICVFHTSIQLTNIKTSYRFEELAFSFNGGKDSTVLSSSCCCPHLLIFLLTLVFLDAESNNRIDRCCCICFGQATTCTEQVQATWTARPCRPLRTAPCGPSTSRTPTLSPRSTASRTRRHRRKS
jgi:hypothetical protein